MDSTQSLKSRAPAALLVFAAVSLFLVAGDAAAQDSTVFMDDFEAYPVRTLARGCGDMTANGWRWESHHYHACFSAGWGVQYGQLASGTTSTDKELFLWGGIPFGGGGDCTAALAGEQFQELSDYTVTAFVSPVMVVNGIDLCKSGMAGIAGRVQGTSTACTGYLLSLSLNSGETFCGFGSYLELYSNERGGPYCDGRDPMRLLASVPVDISADPGGNFAPGEEYVMKLCLSGSNIYGGVWTVEGWEAGNGAPLAEVNVSDDTYSSGTVGLYQGATHTKFDNVVVTVGSDCVTAQPMAVEAELDFDPNTLNTKSNGRYVTCYIELPADYDPSDIDVGALLLNDIVPAESKPTDIGDNDGDGIEDLMVKFSRSAVVGVLTGAGGPSAAHDPSAGGTSGGGEFSWNSTADRTGTSGGGEFGLGGLSSGSRPYVGADVSGISGGGQFSRGGDGVSGISAGGTSGGGEWGLSVGADPSGTSGGGEYGLSAGADASGTSGGAEFSLSGVPDHGDSVEVWVSGVMLDGTAFVGRDTIRVTGPGNGSGSGSGSGSGGGPASGESAGSASSLTVTPSPVKGRARIGFEVVVEGNVRLSVFDAAGRMVRTLVSGTRGVGNYSVTWDRSTDDGRRVAPGVYFVRLNQPGNTSMKKMMVIQ